MELFVRQSLAQGRCHRPQLLGLDVAVLVLVEDLKGFFQGLAGSGSEGWLESEEEKKEKKFIVSVVGQKFETNYLEM